MGVGRDVWTVGAGVPVAYAKSSQVMLGDHDVALGVECTEFTRSPGRGWMSLVVQGIVVLSRAVVVVEWSGARGCRV